MAPGPGPAPPAVSRASAVAAAALVAGSLLAFGGAYRFTAVPILIAAAALAAACRPRILSGGRRGIDGALLALLAAVAAQAVPLPGALLAAVSPAADAFNATYLLNPGAAARPLSIEPRATLYGLAVMAAVVLAFWSCRRICDGGGTPLLARGVAWTGLAVALLAIVQRATSPYAIYWYWQPEFQHAQPFGPFVNRNHFATWVVMAIPLCLGYLLARLHQRHDRPRTIDPLARLARAADARTVWLVTAASVMTLTVFLSRSRSGMISLAAAMALFWILARRRIRRRGVLWLGGYLAALVMVLAVWANPAAVVSRFEETLSGTPDTADRWTIWRETLPATRDFWLTGTGAGTYQTAMLLYQRSYRSMVYFNQAHNQYLQIATEGGALLAVPGLVALAAFGSLARRRLREDRTGMFWIRAGALTGMAAIAIQSVWETGLRMPANAILFATLAAIAIHEDVLASAIPDRTPGPSLRAVTARTPPDPPPAA